MSEVNRFGVARLPYDCDWIFESVQYGKWSAWRPHCVKWCPNRDKCKPPEKEKKRSGYQRHSGSIKRHNPRKYKKYGGEMVEVFQATCPECGKQWDTIKSQKTTCGSQGGKKGCGYAFKN